MRVLRRPILSLLVLSACSRSHEPVPRLTPDAAPATKPAPPPDATPAPEVALDAAAPAVADAGPTHTGGNGKGNGKRVPPDAGPTATASAPDAGPPEPALPRGTTWKVSSGDTVGFAIAVDSPAPIAAGATAHFAVEVTPRDGRKINWCEAGDQECQPFPTKLTLTPPAGLTAARTVYTESDLVIDHHHIAIDVAVTGATPGSYAMNGDLKFAVCTDAECEPKRVKLVFTLGVR